MRILPLALLAAQAVSGAVIPRHDGHDGPETSKTEELIVITITSTKIHKEAPTAIPSAAPPAAGNPSVIFVTTIDYTTVPASGAYPTSSSGARISNGTSGTPTPSVTPPSGTLAVSAIPSLSGSPGTPPGPINPTAAPSVAPSGSSIASGTASVTQFFGSTAGFESIPYESGYETPSYGSGIMSTVDITSFTPIPSQAPASSAAPEVSQTPASSAAPEVSQTPASSGAPVASEAPSPSGAHALSQGPTSAPSHALASSNAAAPSASHASSMDEYAAPPGTPASIQPTTAPTAPEPTVYLPGQTVCIHAHRLSKQLYTTGSALTNPISDSAAPTTVVIIHDSSPEDIKAQGAVNVPAGPGIPDLEDVDFSFSAIKAESEDDGPPPPLISLGHVFEHSISSDSESIVTPVRRPTSAHHFNSMFTPKHSSTLTPTPSHSLAPGLSKVPVSTPEPSKTTSSTMPAGSFVMIGEGKHCPYPYPNEKCGKGAERTTFVTVAKSSVAPTSATTTGWCPYPRQKC
ncbi:hypothetical protein BCR34DRAFT_614747 [Clohesyomyces aquaticus]|uniref:Uncharacterized protein n=1 Tax=Clohesyomyces aquaticus TaxID=1231657 RepID=A0A1Y1ZM05_9PLEO|nr:hypothetical protein BCR34DRAFT_614747 [Clohesyomyces aquaticus]